MRPERGRGGVAARHLTSIPSSFASLAIISTSPSESVWSIKASDVEMRAGGGATAVGSAEAARPSSLAAAGATPRGPAWRAHQAQVVLSGGHGVRPLSLSPKIAGEMRGRCGGDAGEMTALTRPRPRDCGVAPRLPYLGVGSLIWALPRDGGPPMMAASIIEVISMVLGMRRKLGTRRISSALLFLLSCPDLSRIACTSDQAWGASGMAGLRQFSSS